MRAVILFLMLSLSGRAAIGVFQGLLSQTLAPAVSSGTSNPPVNGYNYYWTVTVTGTMVSGTNSNYPVLVSADNTYLKSTSNGGQVTSTNGYDVVFFSNPALTSTLNYECESYSATSGSGNWWVKFPTIQSGSSTVFYMAWGNSSITGSTSSSGTATWDSNYVGVWHLGNGTTLSAGDSTSNENNGTNNGATATAGQIDGGASFNSSSSEYISFASSVSAASASVEIWFKTTSDGGMFGYSNSSPPTAASTYNPVLYTGTDGCLHGGIYNGGGSGPPLSSSATINDGNWHFACFVSNISNELLYLDGSLVASSGPAESGQSGSVNFQIGAGYGGNYWAYTDTTSWFYFNGSLDEARYSNIARSSNWIATEYNDQSNPSAFLTFGSEQ